MFAIKDKLLYQKSRGFTLIEMCAVIIIVGLFTASLASLYKLHVETKKREDTAISSRLAMDQIAAFRNIYGRFPCPASPTAQRDDAPYGHENCSDFSAVPPGTCDAASGVCTEISPRTIQYIDPVTDVETVGQPLIVVGTLPWRSLNLQEEDSYDGFGNRFTYAVTQHLTDAEAFSVEQGGIEIRNENGLSVLVPPASAEFLVLSHGFNGSGAFSANGEQFPCEENSALERENCNQDIESVYVLSQMATTDRNLDQFDDTLAYFLDKEAPLWEYSDGDFRNINQKLDGGVGFSLGADDEVTQTGRLGGTSTLRVQDNGLTEGVTEGELHINSICDENTPENCFSSALIAGDLNAETGGMQCPNGMFATGIANGELQCEREITIRCPDPSRPFMSGIAADGSPMCSTAPCGEATVQICDGVSSTIPSRGEGGTFVVRAGDSAFRTYQCTNGTWTPSGAFGGECVCRPDRVTGRSSCSYGFSGIRYTYLDWQCPQGGWKQTRDESNCVCTEMTDTYGTSCPNGLQGERTFSAQHFCTSSTEGYWTKYTEVSNTCKCVPRTESSAHLPCPEGQSGYIINTRDYQCPSGTYTAWKETTNTCGCTAETESRTVDCPSGETGEHLQSRTYNCTTKAWSDWQTTSNTCKCTFEKQSRAVNCPYGQSGSITEERTRDCTSNGWGDWTAVNNTCKTTGPVVCRWENQGNGVSGKSSRNGGPELGTVCDCGTDPNQICWANAGFGKYIHYQSCVCR